MLSALSSSVKKNKADIGFAFDGDGDRLGVVDDIGNEIFSDKIGLLISRNLSIEHKNSNLSLTSNQLDYLRQMRF